MKIAFSWDDGAVEDLKLMELHQKYNIPGMFFVPTVNREGRMVLDRKQLQSSVSELISFGGHTQHHTYLTSIPIEQVDDEIRQNKLYLEDVLSQPIEHFCLPGGKYNREIVEKVFQQFTTCRTADTMAFSSKGRVCVPTFHFYPRGIKSLVGNAWRQKSYWMGMKTVLHVNRPYFELIRYLTDEAIRRSEGIKDKARDDTRIIVWGHSWEVEELGLWDELEAYMAFIKQTYPEQIAEYKEIHFDEDRAHLSVRSND